MNFKKGDVVEMAGVRGVVRDTDTGGVYPLIARFDGGKFSEAFTSDGRLITWHKKPLLKLISRAKKKKKVTFYINVYKGGTVMAHTSKARALQASKGIASTKYRAVRVVSEVLE